MLSQRYLKPFLQADLEKKMIFLAGPRQVGKTTLALNLGNKKKPLLEDSEGYRMGLFYLRDIEKREVDFLVTVDEKPWFAVEAKLSEEEPAQHLKYFGEKIQIPFLYQVVLSGKKDIRVAPHFRILPAEKFLGFLI